jgi:uncharacterized protein YkwD
MHSRQIVAVVAAVILLGWTATSRGQVAAPESPQPAAESASDLSPVEKQPAVARQIAERTNRFRAGEELPELRASDELGRAARYFADFLASRGKFGHSADDKQPWERAAEYGYEACIVAENIGLEFGTQRLSDDALAGGFVERWKDSKEHRANLLDPDLMEIGVAVAKSEKSGRFYAVQLFGRPKSASIRVEIENRAGLLVKYKVGDETLELEDRVVRTHELCRSAEFTFLLPAAEGEERMSVQRVARQTRLVVQRDDSRELTVVRSTAVER